MPDLLFNSCWQMLQSNTHTTILFSLAAERATWQMTAHWQVTAHSSLLHIFCVLCVCIINTDYDGCMSKKVNVNATKYIPIVFYKQQSFARAEAICTKVKGESMWFGMQPATMSFNFNWQLWREKNMKADWCSYKYLWYLLK